MIGRRRSLFVVLALVVALPATAVPSAASATGVGTTAEAGARATVDTLTVGAATTTQDERHTRRERQVEAANATPVRGCETITEPGRYELTRNVTNDLGTRTSQNCVWINSSDVVFEGNGHRIDGIGVTDSVGVYVGSPTSLENVTVRNVTVSDWHQGLWHRNVANGTIEDVNATDNAIGIGIENATGTRVLDSEATGNLIGFRVTRSTLDALSGNDASGNHGTGIYDRLIALDAFDNQVTVGPPLDPDGDGRYEDVTGDQTVDVADALSLLGIVTADLAGAGDLDTDHREMLDLDEDDDMDYGDVWTLLVG